MKKLSSKPVSWVQVPGGKVECPHCHATQEHIDEYSSDEVYECENCWSHYTVPMTLIEKHQQDQDRDERVKPVEIEEIFKRLVRLEKELGIKK